ncbi:MAG: polyhydroxyalkanoate synthesis repressor PhaR [Hyphomonadaceae bacterium]
MNEQTEEQTATGDPVVIKKYANRRLYNTATSSYVTLESLSDMVRQGVDFTVQDAKTGEDITRAVLTQIIFEQENRGEHLLSVQFLRRLIRFYNHSMQTFVPSYLEMSMESFAKSQENWREQLAKAWGGKTPIAAFEDQARQNMALFEQALKMWAPFAPAVKPKAEAAEPAPEAADALGEMKRQLEAMQRQLDQLSGGRKP